MQKYLVMFLLATSLLACKKKKEQEKPTSYYVTNQLSETISDLSSYVLSAIDSTQINIQQHGELTSGQNSTGVVTTDTAIYLSFTMLGNTYQTLRAYPITPKADNALVLDESTLLILTGEAE